MLIDSSTQIVVNFAIHYNLWVCLCKVTAPG